MVNHVLQCQSHPITVLRQRPLPGDEYQTADAADWPFLSSFSDSAGGFMPTTMPAVRAVVPPTLSALSLLVLAPSSADSSPPPPQAPLQPWRRTSRGIMKERNWADETICWAGNSRQPKAQRRALPLGKLAIARQSSKIRGKAIFVGHRDCQLNSMFAGCKMRRKFREKPRADWSAVAADR